MEDKVNVEILRSIRKERKMKLRLAEMGILNSANIGDAKLERQSCIEA